MIKLNLNFKLFLFIKIFIIYLIICLKSYADHSNVDKSIVAIGSYYAIVKVKIISSFTCPHCSNFHIEVVPKIIKEYVF